MIVFDLGLWEDRTMMNPKSYSIEEIKEKLAPLFNEEGLQMVLLFGSQGSGRTHPESDIDLAVLCEEPVDLLHLTNRVSRSCIRTEWT